MGNLNVTDKAEQIFLDISCISAPQETTVAPFRSTTTKTWDWARYGWSFAWRMSWSFQAWKRQWSIRRINYNSGQQKSTWLPTLLVLRAERVSCHHRRRWRPQPEPDQRENRKLTQHSHIAKSQQSQCCRRSRNRIAATLGKKNRAQYQIIT